MTTRTGHASKQNPIVAPLSPSRRHIHAAIGRRGGETRAAQRKRGEQRARPPVICLQRMTGQRLENWKDRRALARPYFLRSTTRESRVRKPLLLSTARK